MSEDLNITEFRQAFKAHTEENTIAHNKLFSKLEETNGEFKKALFGYNGQAGVTERLRTLERFSESTKKIVWIMVTSMVVGAGSLVTAMVLAVK